jgi:hypothetical protein
MKVTRAGGAKKEGGAVIPPSPENSKGETDQKEPVEVSDALDYLRYTCGHENGFDNLVPRGIPSLSRTGDILMHGSYGYDRTMPLEGGGRIMYHSNDTGMKYCVELSGEPLAEVRREGFEVEDIITHAFSGIVARVSFARVDYCIDVKNGDGTVEELYDTWNTRETTTRAREAMFIQKSKSEYKANTVYFGSRASSPRFLRAYDKGVQLGMIAARLYRLEVEVKKRRCTPFAWSVSKHGRAEAGRREIKDAIKTRVAWVVSALEGALSPRVEVPRAEAHPNEFVRGMIIPFLKNHHGELSQETKALLLMTVEDYISLT